MKIPERKGPEEIALECGGACDQFRELLLCSVSQLQVGSPVCRRPKFNNNVAGLPFFQKFDRARSGKNLAFRSQPDRNVRALNRLLQNGPQLFKVLKLPRTPGDTIALPVFYRSQTDTESVRQRWCYLDASRRLIYRVVRHPPAQHGSRNKSPHRDFQASESAEASGGDHSPDGSGTRVRAEPALVVRDPQNFLTPRRRGLLSRNDLPAGIAGVDQLRSPYTRSAIHNSRGESTVVSRQ